MPDTRLALLPVKPSDLLFVSNFQQMTAEKQQRLAEGIAALARQQPPSSPSMRSAQAEEPVGSTGRGPSKSQPLALTTVCLDTTALSLNTL